MSDSTSTSQSSASSALPERWQGKGYSFPDPGPDPAILELQQRIEAIEAHIGMDGPLPSTQKALELMGVKTEDVGRVFSEHRPPKLQQRVEAIEARHLREDEEEAWRIGTIGVDNKCSFLRMAGVSEEKITEHERRLRVRV